jgi:glucokinase
MSEQIFIGIEIGGTKLQLMSADVTLNILKALSFEVSKKEGATGIQAQIEKSIRELAGNSEVKAVGVGFGGPVNCKTGVINISHQIEGWENFNLRQWLQHLTSAPVIIDNDANVAALGEAVQGAGREYDIVFYMTIGSGIGGGLIIDKKIYHGRFPGEVEVGHLRMNKEGDTLESLCSGWAVDERIRQVIAAERGSELAKLARNEKNEARFLKQALQKNDVPAKIIVQELADDLAFALSHVVHLFHPDIIIIGGGLSLLGKELTDPLTLALPGYLMRAFHPAPGIKIASLGKNVVPVGAIELAKSLFEIK